MNIRSETPADYSRIAELQVGAFGGQIAEALLVTFLRQRREFDPELSIVAEVDHLVVGHVMLSPYTISLLGRPVKAVNVAPLGVEALYQGKGIGEALINEAHRLAREKEHEVSFVIGYDTYYARFGYKTEMFGSTSVTLTRQHLNPPRYLLHTRGPTEADLPSLFALSLGEEYHVDFSPRQGESLMDWISPNPNIHATVYERGDTVVGYTRLHKEEPDRVRVFMAYDKEVAHAMASMLMGDKQSISLPLHPYSKSAAAFTIKPEVLGWRSAMARGLVPGLFDDYSAQLQAGKRLPGRVIWPVAYDLIL